MTTRKKSQTAQSTNAATAPIPARRLPATTFDAAPVALAMGLDVDDGEPATPTVPTPPAPPAPAPTTAVCVTAPPPGADEGTVTPPVAKLYCVVCWRAPAGAVLGP